MLESLSRNPEASKSEIYLYCDGPKRPEHEAGVAETRAIARAHAPAHARIVERDTNFGLARSIVDGVTRAMAQHGRAIVLEDDLSLSPTALAYFNQTLNVYENEPRAMHVSGYMYPVGSRLPKAFFYREASCWGWATWSRSWAKFNPDAQSLLRELHARKLERDFDIGGTAEYLAMLRMQAEGKLDSWAIRWYASVFLAGGLALHPGRSLVRNDGLDGTGSHCDRTTKFDVEPAADFFAPRDFPARVEIDRRALSAMKRFRQGPRWRRAARALFRIARKINA